MGLGFDGSGFGFGFGAGGVETKAPVAPSDEGPGGTV